MVRPASDFDALQRRVARFLKKGHGSQRHVTYLVNALESIGRVGIFGGMIRDLALFGNPGFRGDVDIVVDTRDRDAVAAFVGRRRALRNKFGGHRVDLGRWRADVWTLSDTWAFKQGLVTGAGLQDLVYTTFFSWDAIVFVPSESKFWAIPGYLQQLRSRTLDVNLLPAPDPIKASVRTIRYLLLHGALLTPRLTRFLSDVLTNTDHALIVKAEREGFQVPVTQSIDLAELEQRLVRHSPTLPFSLRDVQLEVPLRFEEKGLSG